MALRSCEGEATVATPARPKCATIRRASCTLAAVLKLLRLLTPTGKPIQNLNHDGGGGKEAFRRGGCSVRRPARNCRRGALWARNRTTSRTERQSLLGVAAEEGTHPPQDIGEAVRRKAAVLMSHIPKPQPRRARGGIHPAELQVEPVRVQQAHS